MWLFYKYLPGCEQAIARRICERRLIMAAIENKIYRRKLMQIHGRRRKMMTIFKVMLVNRGAKFPYRVARKKEI